ncbi:outer membrane efflux protein [Opitutus terrae PB90-1]|uniref:Outer membrane efflux protein n=1 Tax=Opitutus terrae (strain DSM 11246 / JCM 15787 / PB90-1) TaxID=452637 RepID=B1ZZQ5_OPITP|nr:outer membrane efflux protein [Opitutus terrae PB90-1]
MHTLRPVSELEIAAGAVIVSPEKFVAMGTPRPDFLGFGRNVLSSSIQSVLVTRKSGWAPRWIPTGAPAHSVNIVTFINLRFCRVRYLALLFGAVGFVRAEIRPDAGSGSNGQPAPVAGATASDEWTLDRAVARALEANPDLLLAKHEFERQEGARLQLVARMLPQLSASASANERARGLIDRSPGERNIPPSAQTAVALYSYDMRVEVRQLVFDGLASWHQVKRQQLLKKQAYLVLRNTVARTISQVRQGLDAIQLRTSTVAAEKRRVEEYIQLVEWTSRKQAEGEVPEFELLRAEAEAEGARADLAEARRALGAAEQSFRRLLQLPDSKQPVRVAGEFTARPFDLPFEEALGEARANRPDLEAAAVAVAAAKATERAEVGNWLPTVEAFASYGERSSYYNSGIRLDGWTYGVMGEWNLFEGGASRGRRMAARAERRSAETRLAETEHGVVSKLHELYEGLAQARVAMEAQQKSVDMASRAARDARRLYEEGQASLEQVLQATMTLRRAETRLGESIYTQNAMIAEIEFSVGGQIRDSIAVPDTWKP